MVRIPAKTITAVFFRTASGNEPVRDWLLELDREDRKIIGEDIKTCEFGWPIGMPVCRSMGKGLYEVRSHISNQRIARVLFVVEGNAMILLHAFIKKSHKTPKSDMDLALDRLKLVRRGS